jgi:hypothetical protein
MLLREPLERPPGQNRALGKSTRFANRLPSISYAHGKRPEFHVANRLSHAATGAIVNT